MKRFTVYPYVLAAVAAFSGAAGAQTCEQATRNFKVSNGAQLRNQEMVDKAYSQALEICGPTAELRSYARPRDVEAPPLRAPRSFPGQFVNCDRAGCWGSANNVRYSFVAGGNLAGADGSFCTRAAGGNFTCN